ncbi:MAG: class I SAM-dependent methyltransferase [Coriobacteriaceae bacterium]|nr:class I SAM-dependent methyltransferase [Coriobacteriaceae bacterium]
MESIDAVIADNLASWEDRAHVHANGGYGDLTELITNPTCITGVAQRDFEALKPHLPNGSLAGLRLLHLQCHIGTDTICWPRLGAAEVWGLDFSPNALAYARDFAAQAGERVTFVQGDAREAFAALDNLRETFDVIVTSAGTITWLPELIAWAHSIAQLLAPGGVFMIRDDHPMLFALENSGLTVTQSCFGGTACSYEESTTYVSAPNGEGKGGELHHTRNHNWAHDFQEIVGALLGAGLVVESLREYDSSDWRALPMLEYFEDDESWRMPESLPQIPLTFSLVVRKPKA